MLGAAMDGMDAADDVGAVLCCRFLCSGLWWCENGGADECGVDGADPFRLRLMLFCCDWGLKSGL